MGISVALAVPTAGMDGAQPGRREGHPKPQPRERGAGQQLQAGATQGPLRGSGGRGKVFLAAEAARGCQGSSWYRCARCGSHTPAGWVPVDRSNGTAGPWLLTHGGTSSPSTSQGDMQAVHRESMKGMAKNLSMVALSQYHSLPKILA